MSCAEWTGVSLKLVLQEAGLQTDAKWIVAEGADAAALTRSIPIEKCLDDAMLVYSQNGERLRPQQGYPLRLLLPGFEGNMNVKWLRRLQVAAEPAYSREETSKYTDLMPDGTAREFTFYMEAKSIITRPSGGQRLSAPGFHEITGLAWSGHGKIKRVEISVDDGKSWQPAELAGAGADARADPLPVAVAVGRQAGVIQSRAIDETGLRAADAGRIARGARRQSFLPQQRDLALAHRGNGEVSNAQA